MPRSDVTRSTLVNRRSAITAAGASVTALGISRWPTAAQDLDPAAMAAHPAVGVWFEEFDPERPGALLAVSAFHTDGTVTESHPLAGTGIGAWRPTGERTGEQVTKYQNISETPGTFVPGTSTFTGTFTIDEGGETLAYEGIVDLRAMDGASIANFPISGTGIQRMTIASATPPASPAATPTS
jgi:hypothetical protein